MSFTGSVLARLLALFVDDGPFAFAIVCWLFGGWVCVHALHFPAAAEAIVLPLGLAFLLIDSIRKAVRSPGSRS